MYAIPKLLIEGKKKLKLLHFQDSQNSCHITFLWRQEDKINFLDVKVLLE